MSPTDALPDRWLPRPASRFLIQLVLPMVLSLLTGCLVIPIPTGDKVVMSGTRVNSDTIGRIQIGMTTRDEVLQMIGAPILDWEDERILAYQWDVRKMEILWLIGGGYGATGGTIDVPRHHVLLIQFDAEGRVRRVGRTVRRFAEHIGDHLVEWWNADGVKSGEQLLQPDSSKLAQVRVLFRAIGQVQGRSVVEASEGRLRAWRSIFSATTLYSGWGSLHSGGTPVASCPTPLPGNAGKAGWFEVTLRAENNYLFLGPSVELRNTIPASARNFGLVYRLDLTPETPVVYAGSLYLECVFERKFRESRLAHLSSVVKSASEVRTEPDELSAALASAGIAPGSVVTRLMQPYEGVPVLRTPAGSRTRVPYR